MKRRKSEPEYDETTMSYMHWSEDDKKWDRIRRLRAGGITEITEHDRNLQRSWSGIADKAYRAPDVSRPYIWTPRVQKERCDLEALRKMIVDARVDGDHDLAASIEYAYNKLARKLQIRIDRLGGVKHTARKAGYSQNSIREPFDQCLIANDQENLPDEDE